MSGTIYFVACPATSLVKIGFTSGDVRLRVKALQTGSASQLLLMACDTKYTGKPLADWVRVGLDTMHAEHPLPADMVALL